MLKLSPYILAQISQPWATGSGLTVIDWTIVALYALGTLVLGWHFGRKQKSTREYFVGSGGMNWLLIGISLFATLLSTISYLSMPGEAIGKGPVWLATLLGYPIVYLIAGYVLIPVYMRHRVTSAYELLEKQLGRGTRRLGAGLFVLLRLVWMSTLIYFAATALAIIIRVDAKWEPIIVVVAGLVAVGYTSLGGLRAVVITDFLQTVLLYGGALTVIAIVSVTMGGFGWFPTQWHANWDPQPIFSLDPSVRITVVGAVLAVVIWHVGTLGGDQVSVQRFMATTDARAARKSLAANLIVGTIVMITLFLAGFAMLGYYEVHPELLPADLSLENNADKIFPHFIATGLPPVVSGLVVSALLAAAMSSVDSGINSITAVVMSDFLPLSKVDAAGHGSHETKGSEFSAARRQTRERDEAGERKRFRQARLLALAIGAIVITTSSLVKYVPGNITAITGKTVNLLTVPIFCLFFFALFVKNAKPTGAWLGCVAGIIAAVLIAFSGPIFGYKVDTGTDPVSFIWMSPAALLANIAVGWLACRLLPQDSQVARLLKFAPAAIAVVFVLGLLTIWRPAMHIRLNPQTRTRCLQVLQAGMRSDEFWPSIHAAEGITIAGHQDEVRSFLEPKLSSDLDDQQRCGVARELVRAGDPDKARIMLDILAGEDDFAHVHAAESLYKVSSIGDGVALRRAFEPDNPAAVRRMAAAALGKAGDKEALAFLRESLRSDESDGYQIAAWILARIGSTADIEPIRARLNDASTPLVRAFLEHALAALGDKKGLQALSANLESTDPRIRTSAATFAGDARAISVAPKLLTLLDDPDLDARIRAAQSLLELANR